jgi:hypothetical protein
MRSLAVLLVVLSLSATAHAGGGKQKKKDTVRAVIDHTVGGQVVRRTVVTGPRRAKGKRLVGFERERAAAGKGWSVTDRRAAPPRDLTLAGRLEETGARVQRGGQSILTFTRPGAHHLTGDREIRIYTRGRMTSVKKLPRVADRQVTAVGPAGPGTGRVVRSELLVDLLSGPEGQRAWLTVGGMAFRYEPSDPYAVHLEVPNQPDWVFSRDLLGEALANGRSGEADVRLEVKDGYLEIFLSTADDAARLRTPKELARDFLARSHASVPRGTENDHIDFDGDIRRIVDGE